MENAHLSASELVYSYSCSGTLAFRHNLNVPLIPGAVSTAASLVYAVGVEPIYGATNPILTAFTANTFTVSVGSSTAGAFRLVPYVQVGDYS